MAENTPRPDFEKLRAERNAEMTAQMKRLADEWGVPLQQLRSKFNPNACFCACGAPGNLCEHDWTGPWWESDDGCGASATCARCGMTAMHHDLRVLP